MSDCLFCRIVNKAVPAKMVFDGPGVMAFEDIHPQAPVHILIVPKKHIARVSELVDADDCVMGEMHRAAAVLAERYSVKESGFRLVVNNGPDAGQAVGHLHVHLLAGRKLSWPPG